MHSFLNTGNDSKFGLAEEDVDPALEILSSNEQISIIGIHIHVGSTIKDINIYDDIYQYAVSFLSKRKDALKDITMINIGGGLSIDYRHNNQDPCPGEFENLFSARKDKNLKLMLEPGRSIIANSCALICSVMGTKKFGKKKFMIVDGSMTELLRPALYGSYHHIIPCKLQDPSEDWETWDVVGPVCESTDTLATNIELPTLGKGDLIAIMDTGAYVSSMSSNYNLRPRPWELLVDRDQISVIARRENLEDMMKRFNL